MTPALTILCAWLAFGGAHLFLSASPMRETLVKRLGERTFTLLYSLIAAFSLAGLCVAVAWFGDDGMTGLNLAAIPAARWGLGAAAFIGAVLVAAGLLNYFRSPMAVLRIQRRNSQQRTPFRLRAPEGIERITRHPFFVGTVLLMGAHALLADKLAGTVYFAGFTVLALAGIPLQDRKLTRRHGRIYQAYLKETTVTPLAGAHVSTMKDLAHNWPALAAPGLGAVLVLVLHPLLKHANGAAFIILTVAFGLYAVIRQFLKARAAASASPH